MQQDGHEDSGKLVLAEAPHGGRAMGGSTGSVKDGTRHPEFSPVISSYFNQFSHRRSHINKLKYIYCTRPTWSVTRNRWKRAVVSYLTPYTWTKALPYGRDTGVAKLFT